MNKTKSSVNGLGKTMLGAKRLQNGGVKDEDQ